MINIIVGMVFTALSGCIAYLWTKGLQTEHRLTKLETEIKCILNGTKKKK